MEHVLSSAAIRERRASLNRTIADAKAQLADLEVAESILQRFGKAIGESRPDADVMDDLLRQKNIDPPARAYTPAPVDRGLTSRALFKSVLRQSNQIWMTANEIQERASAIKGQEVPMATVSPTLSNMKNDGIIVRNGLKVALASRLKENGEAEASPDAGGVGAPPDLEPSSPEHPTRGGSAPGVEETT